MNLTKHVQPTSWAEATQLAKDISKSELVPKQYRGFPDQILCAIQYGAEIGLSPFQALQSINIINGNASLCGDAMLALVSARPECEGVEETVTGEGDKRHARCEVRRRGWKKPIVCTFSVTDAKKAKLWGRVGPWTNYPDRMLQMRARGFALRNAFQDALKGFISTEEAQDYPVKNSAPVATTEGAVADGKEKSPPTALPPVVESTIEVPLDVPFTEEIQTDPHPSEDPTVPLITEVQRTGVINFIEANELDMGDLHGLGYEDVTMIPKDKVNEVVRGLVAISKEKKAVPNG